MDLLLNVIRAITIGGLGLFITAYCTKHNLSIFYIEGRFNRVQFILGCILLGGIMYTINAFTQSLMAQVIILPAYWGVKLLALTLYVLITPFYYTLYVRRLHDLSLPTAFGIIWTCFLMFSTAYAVVKSTSFKLALLITIFNILLATIPGNKRENQYGPVPSWRQN